MASRPSRTGIRTSISTTSGRVRCTSSTASRPSPACPTTTRSGAEPTIPLRPARSRTWSSATTTLIVTDRVRRRLRDQIVESHQREAPDHAKAVAAAAARPPASRRRAGLARASRPARSRAGVSRRNPDPHRGPRPRGGRRRTARTPMPSTPSHAGPHWSPPPAPPGTPRCRLPPAAGWGVPVVVRSSRSPVAAVRRASRPRSARPGAGDRSASDGPSARRSESRSTCSSWRISANVSRPVVSITANVARAWSASSSATSRPKAACTVITEMLCATMSCRSRAIRNRSCASWARAWSRSAWPNRCWCAAGPARAGAGSRPRSRRSTSRGRWGRRSGRQPGAGSPAARSRRRHPQHPPARRTPTEAAPVAAR